MPALTCPDCSFTASSPAELEEHFASQHGGEAALRELLALGARILVNEGVNDHLGHLSARLPGKDQLLITPISMDKTMIQATPEHLVTVDFQVNKIAGEFRNPGETVLHARIYLARPDVNAIVHAHPPGCLALVASGAPFTPLYQQAGALGPDLPVYQDPALIHSVEEGDALARVLGQSMAVLMKWHGATIIGRNIKEACTAAVSLEKNCLIQAMAASLAGGRPVSPIPQEKTERRLLVPQGAWNHFTARLGS